jgi:hypothetical protein
MNLDGQTDKSDRSEFENLLPLPIPTPNLSFGTENGADRPACDSNSRVESLGPKMYDLGAIYMKGRAGMSDEISLMVTPEGLTALAGMGLAPKSQSRLDELLAKNVEDKLSGEETKELDQLLIQVDELNLLKARAAATLQRIKS